ncbi:SOS-response transcriptional repressor, LexA [Thermosyntropha lipolytica DSM 11003]|uniref:LexA repressor n=1 Tax=Thermosyntropha lipolytica DSM 11003 TaxID=1123382 RepID=A0A1M5PMA3_9FIRM|nr:transcriptional repressor LexA [Thermosyntropha lipolytica]SHH02902.1 SOS-response transcriptional repressor, LexA [Thermosyntropha lipolytica DSM 11003]
MGKKEGLNKRQEAILEYIREKIRTTGYPPSIREIAEAVGLKSSSTVHAHLLQLEEKGYLKRDATKTRAIIPVDMETPQPVTEVIALPLIGTVAAGTPLLAEQNIEDYIPVPASFIGSGTYFLLRVRGESMIEAGILDGDYLIVRQQSNAVNGEIVVAMLENETTVKRIFIRDNYIELKPENSALEPIIAQNVQIIGKVTGLLRKM